MANYDFSTLNSSDLEELVADLLNAQEREAGTGIIFKTFKDGKDKGIDFLSSTLVNQHNIIGQVKHFYRSGWGNLFQDLKKEVPKITKLSPSKYIIATSVDLSVDNTKDILKLFHPYIISISDIYGKKDLNRLIENYPLVLDNQFKLWYSNTEVLRKIISYHIEGRSNEFKEKEIKKKIRLYVETPILSIAREKLVDNNFVIITGEPGVGKTTTAELLVNELIKDDYSLVYIYDKIKEAEEVWKSDDIKQVFYFDDFLGHNALEIQKAKGSETALLKILRRINRTANKKFIFTTRTFILNSAILESERLRQFNIKTLESILLINEYDSILKYKLLNNHIDESELSNDLKDILRKNKIQNHIVSHNNFSPRSIEFITSYNHSQEFTASNFETFILTNFDSPDKIWRHAYEQQINDIDRFLLNTMLSFGDYVDINELEKAFNARLDYEVKYNNFIRPMGAFRSAFKKIENGFIIKDEYQFDYYKFINPSLIDFLLSYIRKNQYEAKRISESAFYLVQLTTRLYSIDGLLSKYELSTFLKDKILHEYNHFIKSENENEDLFTLSLLVYYYFDQSEYGLIDYLLRKITNWEFLFKNYNKTIFIIFLEKVNEPFLIDTIKIILDNFFYPIILADTNINEALKSIKLFINKYNLKTNNFSNKDCINELEDHLSDLADYKIEEDIEILLDSIFAQDMIDDKEQESETIRNYLLNIGISIKVNLNKFGNYDWNEIGTNNYIENHLSNTID